MSLKRAEKIVTGMRIAGLLVDDSVVVIDRRVRLWGAALVIVGLVIVVGSAWAASHSPLWDYAVVLVAGLLIGGWLRGRLAAEDDVELIPHPLLPFLIVSGFVSLIALFWLGKFGAYAVIAGGIVWVAIFIGGFMLLMRIERRDRPVLPPSETAKLMDEALDRMVGMSDEQRSAEIDRVIKEVADRIRRRQRGG